MMAVEEVVKVVEEGELRWEKRENEGGRRGN